MADNTSETINFEQALRFAAVRQAPSIVDARPWRWQADRCRLRLYLERDGRLNANPAHDRLPVISCGAALHHARIVLAACGVMAAVRIQPDPAEPDLLVELEPVRAHRTLPQELDLFAAIGRQQPGGHAPTEAVLRRLHGAASAEGAHLDESGTEGGWCAVIVTPTDDHTAWLNAGNALSAVLLTATDAGLAAAAERGVGGMAGRLPGGFGFPQIAVRIGHPAQQPRTGGGRVHI